MHPCKLLSRCWIAIHTFVSLYQDGFERLRASKNFSCEYVMQAYTTAACSNPDFFRLCPPVQWVHIICTPRPTCLIYIMIYQVLTRALYLREHNVLGRRCTNGKDPQILRKKVSVVSVLQSSLRLRRQLNLTFQRVLSKICPIWQYEKRAQKSFM